MTCDDLHQRLTDYSDGALSAEVCAEAERHLAECLVCADVNHDLKDLARLCREATPMRMPDDLRRRLQGLITG